MRISVSEEICRGHGRCNSAGPDVYELDEDGYCNVGEVVVPVRLEDQALDGAASCPERAISIDSTKRGS